MSSFRGLLAVLALSSLPCCEPRPATAIVLRVRSDIDPTVVRRVQLSLLWTDGAGPEIRSRSYSFHREDGDGVERTFPGSIVLQPPGMREQRVLRIEASVLVDGPSSMSEEAYFVGRVDAPVSVDRALEVALDLPDACGFTQVGRRCALTETCVVAEGVARCALIPRVTPVPVGSTDGGAPEGDAARVLVPLRGARGIYAGQDFTCAILDTNASRCWGGGARGQLGTGRLRDESLPATQRALYGVRLGVAGRCHQCVLTADEPPFASCVGCNSGGQLWAVPSPISVAPVRNPAAGWTAIAAGDEFTCALDAGVMRCWGADGFGQLGNGDGPESPSPVAVSMPAGVVVNSIGVGTAHACAVTTTGAAYCWGDGRLGQLGNRGDRSTSAPSVFIVPAGARVRAIDAGQSHTCALLEGGEVRCAGESSALGISLGLGFTTSEAVAANIGGVPLRDRAGPVRAISVHSGTTCALAESGAVWCWGGNNAGQVGIDPVRAATVPNPVPVTLDPVTIGVATAIAVGGTHSCALVTGGRVYCWGDNRLGQLGQGSTAVSQSFVPVAVQVVR